MTLKITLKKKLLKNAKLIFFHTCYVCNELIDDDNGLIQKKKKKNEIP